MSMRKWIILFIIGTMLMFAGCGSGGGSADDTPGINQYTDSSSENDNADDEEILPEDEDLGPYEPGWYKGDLHAHSLYSDGDSPLCDVLNIAEGKEFDYFVLTEHNTVDNWFDPLYHSDKMTLLYGVEWTTRNGHANIWSDQPFDWSQIAMTLGEIGDAKKAITLTHTIGVEGQEILFSINHPSVLDALCNGCGWGYSYEDSKDVDAMEVWNSRYLLPNMNINAVNSIYQEWIGKGRKLTMVGGSDAHTHQPQNIQTLYNDVGHPTTWVYAQNKTAKGILRGIKQGRTFISTSPKGPFVEFLADIDYDPQKPQLVSYDVMTGDTIPESAFGKEVYFMVRVKGATVPSGILVIKNGLPLKGKINLSSDYLMGFTDKPASGDYYRIEVRQVFAKNPTNPIGELLQGFIAAITNPIYAF